MKKNRNRIVFKDKDTIQVIRKGTTANKKIAAPKEKIIQTYTFSIDQFNYVKDHLKNETKPDFKTFFSLDGSNCMDCPLSGNMRKKVKSLKEICYTNKVMQYSGFISMLKSIINEFGSIENINNASAISTNHLQKFVKGLFIRFGTYGEPTKHPLTIVSAMASASKNWTGYTHQFTRVNGYENYFMASSHNNYQSHVALDKFNYRSFISYHAKQLDVVGIVCPASKEGGDKSNCSACGLCSGNLGKGNKNVKILMH